MNFDPNTGQPIQPSVEPVQPQPVVQPTEVVQQPQQVIQQPVEPQPVVQTTAQPEKENNSKKIIIIVVLVLLGIGLLYAGISIVLSYVAVNDTMNDVRETAFELYAEKIAKDTGTQYVYDSNLGSAVEPEIYVYDITSDLGYTSTNKYKGYVVVDATDSSQTKYYIFLNDGEHALINHNALDQIESSDIIKYTKQIEKENFQSALGVCEIIKKGSDAKCLNRKGDILK